MRLSTFLFISTSLLTLTACGNLQTTQIPEASPIDFSIEYRWTEGSVPPPYHYSYTITIDADGAAQIAFTPDYKGPEVPTWIETFSLSNDQLDVLYMTAVETGVMTNNLKENEDPPVGGSFQRMTITAAGNSYTVPPFLVDETLQRRLSSLETAIENSVPDAIWSDLRQRHAEYMEAYKDS